MNEHETRAELRAAAARLPYSTLEWAAGNEKFPPMHRAAARREMKRIRKREAGWLKGFIARREDANEKLNETFDLENIPY